MGRPASLSRSTGRVRRRPGRPTAEAKLELVESLLRSEEVETGAARALGWLGEHMAINQALCLVVDEDLRRLVGLVGFGLPPAQVRQFSVGLDAREHPLVSAFGSERPVVLGGNGAPAVRPLLPLRQSALVLPLLGRLRGRAARAGLLLVAPVMPESTQDLRWMADLLGQRLLRPGSQARVERDRRLLGRIFDAVPDAILLTDPEGRILLTNSRADALFASREGESEGRRRAVALNNMLFSAALGRSALRGLEPERREVLLVDPAEGSDLLFELLSGVVDEPGEGSAIVSILRNVTDLRRATEEIEENYQKLRAAEAEVRTERDRLDLIIDSVADPIVVTDPGGNIVLMNAPAERLFSLPLDASPEEGQRLRANDVNFTSFVSNLFLSGAEMRYRGGISLVDPKTGASVPVEGVSGKILSEHGEVTAVVTILHDRTEALEKEQLFEQLKGAYAEVEEKVRQATAELARQNELLRRQALDLEQASAAKSQFLANMSHEFRTPLNAILGYTSILLKGVSGELAPQQRENLSRVDSNARHLLAIINDILDISRIEAGRMPLHLADFSLPVLVDEVITEVDPLIARSKLEVAVELDPSLPTIRSDRAKVKQVLSNLITNAVKFTPHGWVRVSARFMSDGREVAVAVADSGIGIAEADQSRIFEDFQQADASSTRQYGGAGLGLAICRRLASMLDGRITLSSTLGEGSAFTLFLPLRLRRR
jgi:PAS domain S-box-containing protein